MTWARTRNLWLIYGLCAGLTTGICRGQTYTINTAAGGVSPGFYSGTGDGGPAVNAGLAVPCNDVALDGAGNLYIATRSLIRKVDRNGVISTVAGGGSSIQDGVPATKAEIAPIAITSDPAGDLYIADTEFGDSRIRKVDTSGIITTVAGGAACCTLGDGGPATQAYIGMPYGVAVDGTGNIYIAQSDSQNNRIRKVVATSGLITTVAGGGSGSGDGAPATSISLAGPTGVAVDAAGNLFIAESGANRIRQVSTSGLISTVAGNGATNNAGDGGPATSAGVDDPWHVAVSSGQLYITQPNDARVRLVTSAGTITTIAGTGTHGFSGDGGPATSAMLDRPAGIAVSTGGAVYIADATSGIARVRLLTPFSPLLFIPTTPCRIADTRNSPGAFGGPELAAGSTRDFLIPNSSCGIPANAAAYSLNVTVVPDAQLGFLTIWPSGQTQPLVSTLNSDGRVKANAAIVPAGANGGVSVFVTNSTQLVMDIDGYFLPAASAGTGLAFYPVSPCRIADTRQGTGPFGAPFLSGGASGRTFPILSSSCNVPAGAQAYSLNFTAVPHGPLGFITVWPTGQNQPLVSTLNALTGAITANAAVVPAGTAGDVSVYTSNDTDLVIDINGYFAPPGAGGLSLYTVAPCRVLDTRNPPGTPPFSGTITVNPGTSGCVPSGAGAQAFVFNATVVPPGFFGYLTLWPDGQGEPLVSTLNALDGAITSNMAIVPTTNGSIDAFASDATQLILDVSSYFAP